MVPAAAFVAGLVTMGFLVGSVFFFRFWVRTRESLFLAFGIAFLLLAANQALVALSGAPHENHAAFYLLRLAGFALIIAAIAVKNLKRGGSPP